MPPASFILFFIQYPESVHFKEKAVTNVYSAFDAVKEIDNLSQITEAKVFNPKGFGWNTKAVKINIFYLKF